MSLLSDVGTSLTGLINSHDGLQLVSGHNCITSLGNDPADGKLKLISGGGSGHEPAHAGYVGPGMLTGAVCGHVFSSPSMGAIVDCLRAVATPEGSVICIVKNYTGDRLNFGLAVEHLRLLDGARNVRVLLVDEDCSIEDGNVRRSVGRRGLAGVVLVHKILGAMADDGVGIDEVYRFGEGLVKNMATIGFTFQLVGDSLQNIEIGKGIHGEPGVYTMQTCNNFGAIVDFLLQKLEKRVPKSSEVILLVNNLGGTSEFLMGIFVKSLQDKVGLIYGVKRLYCGTFLSSLDQAGISVTVLNLGYSSKLLQYLDHEVTVPSMLFGRKKVELTPSKTVAPEKPKEPILGANKCTISEEFGAKLASTIITFVCEALISCTDMLNIIDRKAGDGDTGSTIAKGAKAIQEQLNAGKLDLIHPSHLLWQLSVILERDMGGSSGALYSLFLQGAATTLNKLTRDETVTINHWNQALFSGIYLVAKYALTKPGDRTMLDPLQKGQQQLQISIDRGDARILECVESFTKGCEEAARATQLMVPKAGRAAYAGTSETPRQYQHPDPGAHAVSIWARALLEACKQVIVE